MFSRPHWRTLKIPPNPPFGKGGIGTLLLLSWFFVVFNAHAASGFSLSLPDKKPLRAEAAFVYQATLNQAQQVVAHWDIAPGYSLYKEHFAFAIEDSESILGKPQYPEPKVIQDHEGANYEVYEGSLDVVIPLTNTSAEKPFVLVTHYQGCATSGFCYPPVVQKTTLSLPSIPLSEQSVLVELLSSKPILLILLTFFVLGIGLAFTPCVLPMIPILSSIIVGEAEVINTAKAFRLSLTYVLAMATAYSVLGALAGAAGHNLQMFFQNPIVIGTVAGLFVFLALSMFGLYDLQLPRFVQKKMESWHMNRSGGDFYEAAGMGFFSTFLMSPCLTPALAASLLYIGNTGNIALGAAALFAMGFGMGVPLMVVGVLEGRFLPQTGAWMQAVKSVFGVLLLLVAISMMDRLVTRPLVLFLLGTVAIVFGVYSTVLFPNIEKKTHPGWWAFWRGISLVLISWGGLLLIGAAAGNKDIYAPLQGVFSKPAVEDSSAVQASLYERVVSSQDALSAALAFAKEKHKAVGLYFSATWCASCKKNESVLEDLRMQHTDLNAWWVMVDVTRQTDAIAALMKQYHVFAPPTFLFIDESGNERPELRLAGVVKEADLLRNLRAAAHTSASP